MKSKTKLVLMLSDLHIGSTVGLWPDGFVSNEGVPVGQNKFQAWLWRCWADMNKWSANIINGNPFELVINGDMTEGQHHKTLQIMTADVGDQVSAVMDVISPLVAKAARTHIIKGTEAHTHNSECHIGKALDASVDPATGQHAWDVLDLDVNGCLFNFAHHISTTARPYLEASAHSIALGALIQSRARAGKPVPKVMCRGHRHRHGTWSDGFSATVTLGAWQGLTRFGYKVVPDAVCQPSAIIFDARTTERGEIPLMHQRVYTAQ